MKIINRIPSKKVESHSPSKAVSKPVATILALLFLSAAMPGLLLALDSQYEKNGELFMLVTDPTSRGVYRLNNKQNSTQTENGWAAATWLYDSGDARGIKAATDRTIYTFAHDVTGWQSSGIRIDRYVRWRTRYPNRNSYYGYHAYHHAYHSGCNDSNCIPHLTGGSAAGVEATRRSHMIPVNGTSFGSSGWYSITNGLWYHTNVIADMSPAKSGEEAARFTYNDTVQVKKHNYNLYKWNEATQAIGTSAAIARANVAESQEEKMTRHILNGCHDGCTSRSKNEEVPAISQITDVTITMTNNVPHTYFYIRADKAGARGKIIKDGVELNLATEQVIGDPHDSTTRFIGASSKSGNKDFIYVLGNNTIKNWLSSVGFSTSNVRIDKISVSDMWWQTGGMVFALDSTNKVVYKFERNEFSNTLAAPMMITIPAGVTDISSDGFGNLYYANTIKNPVGNPPPFGSVDIDYANLSWAPDGSGFAADIPYMQGVEKTVWQRNYYNGTTTKVGKVRAGIIPWKRRAFFSGPMPPRNKPQWDAAGGAISFTSALVKNGNYDESFPSEISVINLASPPQVKGFKDGHVDVAGPYMYDSLGAATLATPPYQENNIYQFRVENFPWFDDYGVNTNSDMTSSQDDINGNGFTGGFVSTIVKKIPSGWPNAGQSGIKYTWKIIKRTDRYGKPVPASKQVVMGPMTTSNPIINFLYEGGDYEVHVSANFHWYDYDQMPAGRLFSERHIVASYNTTASNLPNGNIAGNGSATGLQAKAYSGGDFTVNPSLSVGGNGITAWAKMKVQRVEILNIPGGVGEIVCNPTYRSSDPFNTPGSIAQKWDSRSILNPTNSAFQPKGYETGHTDVKVFTVDEDSATQWTIKENQTNFPSSQYNLAPQHNPNPKLPPRYLDRLKTMFLDDSLGTYTLPDPNYNNAPNTTQKVYRGELLKNPEFRYIVYRDPLVIPYTSVGSNSVLPTIRWKDAWDENTGTQNPSAGPNVKWSWELIDSTNTPVIVGEQNSNTSPELASFKTDASGNVTLNIWDTPSAPGLYRLTVKINRIYVYNTFEEVGSKWNPATGNIDRRVEPVEHAHNILIGAQCLVYVRDITPAQLFAAVNGSDITPKFYGYTGSPINTILSSAGASGGTSGNRTMEIYVEDNNPFDSGLRNPQLDVNSSATWFPGGKPTEFDRTANMGAIFDHETAVFRLNSSLKPNIFKTTVSSPTGATNESDADRNSSQDRWHKSYGSMGSGAILSLDGPVVQFKYSDGTLKPFDNPHTVSIVKYTADLSLLNRFSVPFNANAMSGIENSDPDVTGAHLPYYYASNPTNPASDFQFFIHTRDSSGNVISSPSLASLEMLDNVKPNIFLRITELAKLDLPGTNPVNSVPRGFRETYMRYFFADTLSGDTVTGSRAYSGFTRINDNDWLYSTASFGDVITTSVGGATFPNSTIQSGATNVSSLTFPDISEDSRIKFEIFTSDNYPYHFGGADSYAGAIDMSDLTAGNDPDLCVFVTDRLCTSDDIASGSVRPQWALDLRAPQSTGDSVTTNTIVNFRNPGEYYIVGYIRDRAPATSRDSNVTITPNRREFRFRLNIADTMVNVHTLDSR
ncbi:MAG: hypothetical protein CVV64_07365 [Candidatus Wallbacteria bacterium HGW-Wallbacteria-1]|uniref:Uncharacterized protein n=1 Tax=Candidatus Wallbacteria bacterium HGW-Wallbacteria-1 TaxID=2013854 RepID=A0A2N1PQS1_9BACT|nr:MAG: hypothetical protein CVV64_07365 [Candidatus Wallbacteria bacterium HGW-Wallbacteria-1]